MAVGLFALIIDRSTWGSSIPYHLTGWCAVVTLLLFALRSLSVSVGVRAITFFFGIEALGLMPEAMRDTWIGVPLKYYVLLVTLAGLGFISGIGFFRQALGKYYEPATEH